MAAPSSPKDDLDAALSPVERVAIALTRFANERPVPKLVQDAWLRHFSRQWIKVILARRILIDGWDKLLALEPGRGVLLASNHRSFFDQYAILLAMYSGRVPWAQRLYFPVRSNFFYDQPLGVAINFAIGGGVMYPPVFRQGSRAALNKDALDRMARFLDQPGTIVGVHPEGTRGKGPDPYELLPAQPGIGQIALHAKSMVIPAFINGLDNDFVRGVRTTFRRDSRRTDPVIVVFGDPIDYSDLTVKPPRLALAKRAADRFRDAIAALGPRERELRARAADGAFPDDHPGWLPNIERAATMGG
jgi:1-acyl-sn-glycerol-3-phosphate acyltransferase